MANVLAGSRLFRAVSGFVIVPGPANRKLFVEAAGVGELSELNELTVLTGGETATAYCGTMLLLATVGS